MMNLLITHHFGEAKDQEGGIMRGRFCTRRPVEEAFVQQVKRSVSMKNKIFGVCMGMGRSKCGVLIEIALVVHANIFISEVVKKEQHA
jgi:hypothetical protein